MAVNPHWRMAVGNYFNISVTDDEQGQYENRDSSAAQEAINHIIHLYEHTDRALGLKRKKSHFT